MRLIQLSLLLISSAVIAETKPERLKSAEFDKKVQEILSTHKVPGAAVAVVTSKGLIMAKGYGLRDVENKLPVTEDTLFPIASTSKAFTATGLGILSESKSIKFSFNTPIRKYMKDFRLRNSIATRMTTSVDLLAHRTGLPRHDLVWYRNSKVTRKQIYQSLKYLEFSDTFRNRYQYNNLMYMTAGVLIERLSGKTWEDFTREKILDPLNMKRTNFKISDLKKDANHALPYTMENKKLVKTTYASIEAIGPAGTMNSSVKEMSRWVQLQLDREFKNSPKIVTRKTLDYIHSSKVAMPRPVKTKYKERQFDSYGLGWAIGAYRGERIFIHGGGIDGSLTYVLFAPDSDFGLIVLTNGDHVPGMAMITHTALDLILAAKNPRDWSKDLKRPSKPQLPPVKKEKLSAKIKYDATLTHPAYGTIKISKVDDSTIKFKLNDNEEVKLPHIGKNVFAFDRSGKRLEIRAKIRKKQLVALKAPLQRGVRPILFKKK